MYCTSELHYLSLCIQKQKDMKNQTKATQKFYNINSVINANSIEMVDGSKWVKWSLDRIKDGLPLRNLNRIADMLTN